MFDCWGFDISTPRRCAFYCYWYFLRVVSHKKCQIYFLTLQYFRNHLSLIAKYERMDIFRMLRPAHYLLHKNYFIDVWSFVLFNLLLDMKSHMYFRNVQNSNGQNIIGHYLSIKSIIIHFSLGMLHVQEIGFFFFFIYLLINTHINGIFRHVSCVLVDFQFALVFSREGPMELLLPAASRRPVTFFLMSFFLLRTICHL